MNTLTDEDQKYTDSETLPWQSFLEAAESRDSATSLTHPLYRYPARMSPQLARALILGLTRPGDLVLDPFVGGGTTAIEALSTGRRVICSDLNPLACFVTRAKAWPADNKALHEYQMWSSSLISNILHSPYVAVLLSTPNTTEFSQLTESLLLFLRTKALCLENPGARRLALFTVLRVGQLCYDCRRVFPSPWDLIQKIRIVSKEVLKQMKVYSKVCRKYKWPGGFRQNFKVFESDAENLPDHVVLDPLPPVSLILTSPPYPCVHVLYHRWQLLGRKETSLPYQILQLTDGAGESHYTFGSRKRPDGHYFTKLYTVFKSLKSIITPSTIVAQVVGFSDPKQQLPRFRSTMEMAGFEEVMKPNSTDGIIKRIVPHRKWYVEVKSNQINSHEFVLLHRPCQ